jgi:hypothetical protein
VATTPVFAPVVFGRLKTYLCASVHDTTPVIASALYAHILLVAFSI